MTYRIQYTIDGGPKWYDDRGVPFKSLDYALAVLRHLTRTEELDSWRIVDDSDRQIVAIHPGERGAA